MLPIIKLLLITFAIILLFLPMPISAQEKTQQKQCSVSLGNTILKDSSYDCDTKPEQQPPPETEEVYRVFYDKKLTNVISPLAKPLPQIPLASSDVLQAQKIFDLINTYRKNMGYSPFKIDEKVCKVAMSRLPQLYDEIWGTTEMHSGFYNRDLPYFATENLISMNTEEEAINWWLNSSIHRWSIDYDFKYSCVACKDNNCTQVFTSFEPEQI